MELKPCPFCGGQLEYFRGTGVDCMTQDNRPAVGCHSCGWLIHGKGISHLLSIVNHRPTEDALRKRVEKLEGLLIEAHPLLLCVGGKPYESAIKLHDRIWTMRKNNALTPPATEVDQPRFSTVVAADGSGVVSEGSIVADSRTGKIVGVVVKATEAEADQELTIEEMARALADADECPDAPNDVGCVTWQLNLERSCEECWMNYATEAEIRTRYAEMKATDET